MRILTAIIGILFLIAPSVAHAKRIDKMSTGELIKELKDSEKPERRVQAAQRLGETGAREATAALGNVCNTKPAPEVCVAVVQALAALDTSEALTKVQRVLEMENAPSAGRRQALATLMKTDESRLRDSLPMLISVYSGLSTELLSELWVSVRLLEMNELADAAVLVASDERIDLSARVSALDTAEHFAPPRLFEAHTALLTSSDSKVRARCADSLGAPGVPASRIVPLLKQVVRQDPEGYVRASAITALANFSHPDLLTLLHERLDTERHPVGFQATLNLTITLADENSSPHLAQLLENHHQMRRDQIVTVIYKLAHLRDPSSIPAIFAVEQRHQGSDLAKVCRKAVTILQTDELGARKLLEELPDNPRVPTVPWDPESADAEIPILKVQSAPNGLNYAR